MCKMLGVCKYMVYEQTKTFLVFLHYLPEKKKKKSYSVYQVGYPLRPEPLV